MAFRTSRSGEIIVSKSPGMFAVVWSPAQQEQRQSFKAAIAYAKAAMANPVARTIYEKQAAEQGRKPYRMAVSDYFKGIDLLSGK